MKINSRFNKEPFMGVLNCGIRYIFTKDYITECRYYKEGTICNTLNGAVVLGKNNEFLFDVDSESSKKYGEVIK